MKIESKSQANRGSTFIACLCVAVVTGIMLASYLSLTHYQFASVVRSAYWNRAIIVSEAGVEDGLQLINKFSSIPGKLDDWSRVDSYPLDHWELIAPNRYHVKRTIGADSYDSYVITTGATPVVVATATIALPYAFSVAAVGVDTPTIARKVVVGTKKEYFGDVPLGARNFIDLNGKNIHTDSFDSLNPLYNTGGAYDPTKTRSGGDILTDGQLVDTVSIGNATVNGHVKTGPEGIINIGNGSVGDQTWTASHTGIQPNWSANDMNVEFPSMTLPGGAGNYPLTVPGGLTVGSNTYDHAFTVSGNYTSSTLPGKIYIAPGADVKIYLTGNYNQTGNDVIKIDIASGVSGKLTIYAGGSSFKVAGNGIINGDGTAANPGNAANFALFGLSTLTSLDFAGNFAFTGTIYAPDAAFSLGGGGSTVYDFVGSAIVKSVKMNGHCNFHYDEALRGTGMPNSYTPISWEETKAN